MNKFFPLIVLLSTVAVVSAQVQKTVRKPSEFKSGSKCGLVDTWGEGMDDADISITFDLDAKTFDEAKAKKSLARKVKLLPKVVQNQFISAAAKINFKATGATTADRAAAAARYIQENSEGGELAVLKATINKKPYSVINYYGGGNLTGFIFAWGQTNPLAEIGDGDIGCY